MINIGYGFSNAFAGEPVISIIVAVTKRLLAFGP